MRVRRGAQLVAQVVNLTLVRVDDLHQSAKRSPSDMAAETRGNDTHRVLFCRPSLLAFTGKSGADWFRVNLVRTEAT